MFESHLEDLLLILDPCQVSEDSESIDTVNAATCYWVDGNLATSDYLDVVHHHFNADAHIAYAARAFEQNLGVKFRF